MGFSFSNKKEQELQPVQQQTTQLQLSKGEVEALLTMIKSMNFRGDQIEDVYNLVLKLQEYYISLKD
jgi:hypothetical protein